MAILDAVKSSSRALWWCDVLVPSGIGALLMVASILKGFAAWQTGASFDGAVAIAELALGILLVCRAWPRMLQLVSFLVFSGFAIRTFGLVSSGSSGCNCFGAIVVNPVHTFALDLFVLSAIGAWSWHSLYFGRVTDSVVTMSNRWYAASLFATAYVALLFVYQASQPIDNGLVVSDVTKWQGRRLPLIESIESRERLDSGRWLLLFVHANCPKCDSAIRSFLSTASPERLMVVELPPYHPSPKRFTRTANYARLRPGSTVSFLATPVAVEIDRGFVTSVITY